VIEVDAIEFAARSGHSSCFCARQSELGNYLLCEQHKVPHTTSIVSISTYAVTHACIELSEGVLNSDGTGPKIEFRRQRTSAYLPDMLVTSLELSDEPGPEIEFHEWTGLIGRICSLRAFPFPSRNW
jgi:hypothetical protein